MMPEWTPLPTLSMVPGYDADTSYEFTYTYTGDNAGASPMPSPSPFDGPSGEEACEDNGFDASECAAVGCCMFDDGACMSGVGDGACSGGVPCTSCCPAGVCDSPADASKPECGDCMTCQQSMQMSGTDTCAAAARRRQLTAATAEALLDVELQATPDPTPNQLAAAAAAAEPRQRAHAAMVSRRGLTASSRELTAQAVAVGICYLPALAAPIAIANQVRPARQRQLGVSVDSIAPTLIIAITAALTLTLTLTR